MAASCRIDLEIRRIIFFISLEQVKDFREDQPKNNKRVKEMFGEFIGTWQYIISSWHCKLSPDALLPYQEGV